MVPSAKNALKILEKVYQSCDSQYLAYLILPNVVLSLSGARAFCDGIFWSKSQDQLQSWYKEVNTVLESLKVATNTFAVETEIRTVREDETNVSFEVLLVSGLQYVLKNTNLININNMNLDKSTIRGLMDRLVVELKGKKQLKAYNDEDLNHVAFGILVGYPDVAIINSVLEWDNVTQVFVDADIKGADFYICPKPVYSYPKNLAGNLVIEAHEKNWSKILKDFYSSDFHKKLQNDSKFMNKMKELDNLH